MKMLSKYVETRKEKYIEWFVFILFSVLVCLIDNAYSFNPFVIPLIYFAYQRGINTYLITSIGMLFVGFFTSIDYGIELVIIQLVFFLSSVVSSFLKGQFLKKYGSFVFTNLIFSSLFLIKNFSLDSGLNMVIMIVISSIILYGYENLIKCIYEKDHEFSSLGKVIVLSSFSVLFYGFQLIYIVVVRILHLISARGISAVEGLLSIILNCFIIYAFQNASTNLIITLVLPSIIAVMFNKKYSHFVYLICFVLVSIYIFDDFYLNKYFYQGIVSFTLYLFIPEKVLAYIEDLFKRDESKKIIEVTTKMEETSNAVNNIVSYLDIVLNHTFDEKMTPEEKMLKLIKEKVCADCENKDSCNLSVIIEKCLTGNLTKDERTILFKDCLYPYKILRNTRLKKNTLDNEKHFIDEIQNRNDIYKQEIEMIYDPLRNIFITSALVKDKKSQIEETLEDNDYLLREISIYEDEIKLHIVLKEKEEINNVVKIISKILNKTFYLEDMFYILCLNEYEVSLSCKPLFDIEKCVISKGVDDVTNGDSYLAFKEDGHYYLVLSDGIGHNKQSSYLSSFLTQAINVYRRIDTKLTRQISNANILLKSKIDEEKYATLDYVDIDLVLGKMEMFKCGSFYSYLYRNGVLSKFKSNTPPLGILYDIKTSSLIKELTDGDILIFMSDGYMDEPDYYIEEILKTNQDKSTHEIGEKMHNHLLSNTNVKDDKTLIILKFVKIKKNKHD